MYVTKMKTYPVAPSPNYVATPDGFGWMVTRTRGEDSFYFETKTLKEGFKLVRRAWDVAAGVVPEPLNQWLPEVRMARWMEGQGVRKAG